MILPQTWRCTEIKMFALRRVCVQPRRGALLSVPWWQLKRESVFANLYSYLIWNECHSHSLLVTETGANMEAKWTNRWLVCELLCLQGLSVLLLIRLIMHPESILQLLSDWSWCAHFFVRVYVCCSWQSYWRLPMRYVLVIEINCDGKRSCALLKYHFLWKLRQ